MPTVRCRVNGQSYEDDVEPRLLLVHYLRDTLGLTGTKIGCDTTNCGACTVHVDGYSVKSCSFLAVQADGSAVTTIEGLDGDGSNLPDDARSWHPVQRAFHTEHGLQCGYCTPGMIMATVDLLRETPNPTDEDIRHGLEGNLCRCTGYRNILSAVRVAADDLAHRSPATAPDAAPEEPARDRSAEEVVADEPDEGGRQEMFAGSGVREALARRSSGKALGRAGRALAGAAVVVFAVRLLWRALRSARD